MIWDAFLELYGNTDVCLLQKFLRSHTKKKSVLSKSPSLSQVKLSQNGFVQRMKSCDSKG